jgi:hypothetical protein
MNELAHQVDRRSTLLYEAFLDEHRVSTPPFQVPITPGETLGGQVVGKEAMIELERVRDTIQRDVIETLRLKGSNPDDLLKHHRALRILTPAVAVAKDIKTRVLNAKEVEAVRLAREEQRKLIRERNAIILRSIAVRTRTKHLLRQIAEGGGATAAVIVALWKAWHEKMSKRRHENFLRQQERIQQLVSLMHASQERVSPTNVSYLVSAPITIRQATLFQHSNPMGRPTGRSATGSTLGLAPVAPPRTAVGQSSSHFRLARF